LNIKLIGNIVLFAATTFYNYKSSFNSFSK
jgi:hypothetical protein